MTRWIIAGILVCAALAAWAIHDLDRTLGRALAYPEENDDA